MPAKRYFLLFLRCDTIILIACLHAIIAFALFLLLSFSAETAAFAYANMDPSRVETVFVLGPSHHVHIRYVEGGLRLPSHARNRPVYY